MTLGEKWEKASAMRRSDGEGSCGHRQPQGETVANLSARKSAIYEIRTRVRVKVLQRTPGVIARCIRDEGKGLFLGRTFSQRSRQVACLRVEQMVSRRRKKQFPAFGDCTEHDGQSGYRTSQSVSGLWREIVHFAFAFERPFESNDGYRYGSLFPVLSNPSPTRR